MKKFTHLFISLALIAVMAFAVTANINKATADETVSVEGLLSEYYNNGNYDKVTTIDTSVLKATQEVLAANFHGGATEAGRPQRKTLYRTIDSNPHLFMTDENGHSYGINSGYMSEGETLYHFTATVNGNTINVDANSKTVCGSQSLDKFYVTLGSDCIKSVAQSGWINNSGVYTRTSSTNNFQEFMYLCAPCFTNSGKIATFSKVEIQKVQVNGVYQLQIRLYIDASVFATAIFTKI